MNYPRIQSLAVLLSLVFLIFSAAPAYATSGACSDHQGVNCAAGPAPNGDAICNDDFHSSTSYYATEECVTNMCSQQFASSTYQTYVGLTPPDRQVFQTTVSSLLGMLASNVKSDTNAYNAAVASEDLSYQQQLLSLQSQEQGALAIYITNDRYAPADQASVTATYQGMISDLNLQHQQNLVELASENEASSTQSCIQLWTQTQSEMQSAESYCTVPSSYGPYSEPAPGNLLSCICKAGYMAINGKCEDDAVACQDLYGQSATVNSAGSCACPAGETADAAHHSCDLVSPPTSTIKTALPATSSQNVVPALMSTPPVATVSKVTNVIAPAIHPTVTAATSSTSSISVTAIEQSSLSASQVGSPAATPSFLERLANFLAKLNPFSWF